MSKSILFAFLSSLYLFIPQYSSANVDPPPVEQGVDKPVESRKKKRIKGKRVKRKNPKERQDIYTFFDFMSIFLSVLAVGVVVAGIIFLSVGFIGGGPLWFRTIGTIGIFSGLVIFPFAIHFSNESDYMGAVGPIAGGVVGLTWFIGGIILHVLGIRHGFQFMWKLGLSMWIIAGIAILLGLFILFLIVGLDSR